MVMWQLGKIMALWVCVGLMMGCTANKDNGKAAANSDAQTARETEHEDTGSAGTNGNGETGPGTSESTESETAAVENTDTSVSDGDTGSDVNNDRDSGFDACEAASAEASFTPVYLAFAFDVSGSMGQMDKPWHDPELKWKPVVAATTAFLGDEASDGFFASLTFFPSHVKDRCEVESYVEPDVPFTPLPSALFSEALTEIGAEDWVGSTPTRYVLEGMRSTIATEQEQSFGAFAIVLVTDGYPQGCDDNDMALVTGVASDLMAEGIPTYVIGVNNPPLENAPDTLDNLHEIAAAGGTGSAFIIETGEAEKTTIDFRAAVDEIRGAAVSCDLEIPAPPEGREFDRASVLVTATWTDEAIELSYSPNCEAENGWHYDDVDNPRSLSLCPDTCESIQSHTDASLQVAFMCEKVIEIE